LPFVIECLTQLIDQQRSIYSVAREKQVYRKTIRHWKHKESVMKNNKKRDFTETIGKAFEITSPHRPGSRTIGYRVSILSHDGETADICLSIVLDGCIVDTGRHGRKLYGYMFSGSAAPPSNDHSAGQVVDRNGEGFF
jgi:hypothetical protein